jgi:hypothetical protein
VGDLEAQVVPADAGGQGRVAEPVPETHAVEMGKARGEVNKDQVSRGPDKVLEVVDLVVPEARVVQAVPVVDRGRGQIRNECSATPWNSTQIKTAS